MRSMALDVDRRWTAATWLTDDRWSRLLEYTLRLQEFVERTYGELNIVRIARAVGRPREAGAGR